VNKELLNWNNTIQRNLFKGYFQTGCKQLEQLKKIAEQYEIKGWKMPKEVEDYLESEEWERVTIAKWSLDINLKSIHSFEKDWEVYTEGKDYKVYYNPVTLENGANSFQFGGETIIHSNFLNPVTILNEQDLLTDWVPQLKSWKIISEK